MNQVLVGSLSALLLAGIGVLVKFANAYIASHFKPAQLAALYDIARTAVAGAQEFGVGRDLDGPGKLEMAGQAVVDGAKKLGLKVTTEEVDAFVHAALREMKQLQVLAMPGGTS